MHQQTGHIARLQIDGSIPSQYHRVAFDRQANSTTLTLALVAMCRLGHTMLETGFTRLQRVWLELMTTHLRLVSPVKRKQSGFALVHRKQLQKTCPSFEPQVWLWRRNCR